MPKKKRRKRFPKRPPQKEHKPFYCDRGQSVKRYVKEGDRLELRADRWDSNPPSIQLTGRVNTISFGYTVVDDPQIDLPEEAVNQARRELLQWMDQYELNYLKKLLWSDTVPPMCKKCIYFSGAKVLPCAVHPKLVEENCKDFEAKT